MKLSGIEEALKEGCHLHGFRSGGGLRVIRIEKNGELNGYGEHPNVEEALSYANEDFLAGGREYKDVYGKLKPHYWTGSQTKTSSLDAWLLRGNTIDSYVQKGNFIVELRGYAQTEIPAEVRAQVRKTGRPIVWMHRGFTYETSQSCFSNGEPCDGESTRILKSSEDKNRSAADPWLYRIRKTGKAKEFFKAVHKAFEAEEVEETTKQ